MADEREIAGWRQAYRNSSEAELIRVMREKVPYCAEHIAAEQALADRRQTDATRKSEADKDHRQAQLAQAERHHSDRQRWTRVAAAVAFVSAAAGWVSFAASRFFPPPEVNRRLAAIEQRLATGSQAPTPAPQQQTLPTPASTQVSTPSTTTATPALKTVP